MTAARRRRYVLAGLLVAVGVLAAVVLRAVVETVFFAITMAYVLQPFRTRLRERGFSDRAAAATVAAGTFGIVVVVLLLLGFTVYQRRQFLVELLQEIPGTVTIPVGGLTYTVESALLLDPLQSGVREIAIGAAAAAPVLALKLFLFVVLLYGLLLRPHAAGRALLRVVPSAYHDVVYAFHERVRATLEGIYILQAATAFGTFLIAAVLFAALGYPGAVTLAVVAGLLQFIPVIGPGLLLGVLAIVDVLNGAVQRAVLVAVLGGLLIGLVPDAVIRPRLATYAADLPTSLYFIGFVGGILSIGAVGVIAGPLVVALVVETVHLLAANMDGPDEVQTRLDSR